MPILSQACSFWCCNLWEHVRGWYFRMLQWSAISTMMTQLAHAIKATIFDCWRLKPQHACRTLNKLYIRPYNWILCLFHRASRHHSWWIKPPLGVIYWRMEFVKPNLKSNYNLNRLTSHRFAYKTETREIVQESIDVQKRVLSPRTIMQEQGSNPPNKPNILVSHFKRPFYEMWWNEFCICKTTMLWNQHLEAFWNKKLQLE